MKTFKWENLLQEFSLKLIAEMNDYRRAEIQPEVIESGWLGYPGATEEQIKLAEARLGTTLPSSYREFFKITNGWRESDWTYIKLWSTEEVDWFCVRNQDWIDVWTEDIEETPSVPDEEYFVYGKENQNSVNLRPEYLQTALEISSYGDGDIYLLIPEIISADGEWEAWHFGNKLPGAYRYESFYQLMEQALEWGRFVW